MYLLVCLLVCLFVCLFAELMVSVTPDNVTEGQNATLTCRSSCPLRQNAKLVWYKNSQPLPKKNSTINNTLYLDPVSSEDAGSYSCGVDGYEDDLSPAVTLSVRCEYV